MKTKKWIIIISIILVVIIIAGIVIGICLKNRNKEGNEEVATGSKWGDTYYAYLKEAIKEEDLTEAEEKYGMIQDMKDAKLQFCEVEENQDPTMIMTYKKDENSYVNVYQVTDENKVIYVAYKQPTEIEYLYNIEKDNYSWYIHTNNTSSDSYSSLKNIVDNLKKNSTKSEESSNVNIAEIEADYTINKDEAEISQEIDGGEVITISKFDEIFIKPGIEQNKQIDFNSEMKEKDLKDEITQAVEEYQKETQKVTDEIKEDIAKKVEEVKAKMEKIEKAKEEAKKGLKVGEYTLKYGKYVEYVGDYKTEGVLVLNPGGTCSLSANWQGKGYKAKNFKYKVGTYDFSQDIEPNYYVGIALLNEDGTINSKYMATSNTTLSDGDLGMFKYVEGTDNTTTTSKNENVVSTPIPDNQSSKGKLTSFEYDTSANNPIATGKYYRGKDTGTESVLEIKNATGNSFDFSINAIYMLPAGYPNLGEISGTAKAIKGGSYVCTFHEDGSYGFDYNIFFRIAGGETNPTITIEDEWMYVTGRTDGETPYCGHNVTFEGTYSK